MPTFLFTNGHRWLKFGAALLILILLGVYGGVRVVAIRPSVLRYEGREDEFDGRRFALYYVHVLDTRDSHLTLDVRRGAGLRVTDAARSASTREGERQPHASLTIGGATVRPGDIVSLVGAFRKPDLFVVDEVRVHPRRLSKYLAAIPAFVVIVLFAWRRLRVSKAGIFVRERRSRSAPDA